MPDRVFAHAYGPAARLADIPSLIEDRIVVFFDIGAMRGHVRARPHDVIDRTDVRGNVVRLGD